MKDDRRREVKARLIAHMRSGRPWDEAAREADLRVGRATAYRLLRRARAHGDANATEQDGRHGHASKVRLPVREWLAEYCRGSPQTPGRIVQTALHDRFGLTVSISQINRIRAALGVSRRRGAGGKEGGQAAA